MDIEAGILQPNPVAQAHQSDQQDDTSITPAYASDLSQSQSIACQHSWPGSFAARR
jgi:hypothetical protein